MGCIGLYYVYQVHQLILISIQIEIQELLLENPSQEKYLENW